MVTESGAYSQAPGHDLEALREDRMLWGLSVAVLACLALGLALMALWEPAFGALLLAAYLPLAAALVVLGRIRTERRVMLVRILAAAVEQGMPLTDALGALAEQHRGRTRGRLLALAGLLKAGAPLPEALRLVPTTLPRHTSAMIGPAWNSGHLAEALREAADVGADSAPLRAEAAARIGYLTTVFVVVQLIMFFLFYFIMPKFEAIFHDFGLELPGVTTAAIHGSRWAFAFGWPLLAVLLAADLTLPIVLPLAIGGWIEGGFPLVDRLFPSRHAAPVLRALAWMVRCGQPLPAGIGALLRFYPSGWVRDRLELVLHDLGSGADVWTSLRNRKLIRRADAAVLESARHAGNLAWALRETAEGAERRSVVRLRGWLFNLTTLALLALGGVTLFLTTAILQPLVVLIRSLAG